MLNNEQLGDFLCQFDINPELGTVHWATPSKKRDLSKQAGCLDKSSNRWRVKYNNITLFRYQMIFAYEYGYIPDMIDHKDRIRDNDKISNLRDADSFINASNRSLLSKNKFKITGIEKNTNTWRARITRYGVISTLYSGYDFFEACCARKSAENNKAPTISKLI